MSEQNTLPELPDFSCEFTSMDNVKCKRIRYENSSSCIFHAHHLRNISEDYLNKIENVILLELEKEIEQKKGDWMGFYFPLNFNLPKIVDFPIDGRWSHFRNLRLEGVIVESDLNFSGSKFHNDIQFKNCTFNGDVKLDNCVYEKKVEFENVKFEKQASFLNSEFLGRTLIRANFREPVNFSNVIFADAVTFAGWRNITLKAEGGFSIHSSISATLTVSNQTLKQKLTQYWQKIIAYVKKFLSLIFRKFGEIKSYVNKKTNQVKRVLFESREGIEDILVFEKEALLSNIIFYKPDQVVFLNVNMINANISGTNFRGARFLGVNWFQPKLNRSGLYEEIWIRNSGDKSFFKKQMPQLEESYRNIRATLEDNLNYSAAADFYIGEMDAQRSQLSLFKRYILSVVAWYKIVSNYGTSVPKAFSVLLILLFLHIIITLTINIKIEDLTLNFLSEVIKRSFAIFAFQSIDIKNTLVFTSLEQMWADIGLRLFGLGQLAMLIFAFRSRIKRH